jgi:hypothetical protein
MGAVKLRRLLKLRDLLQELDPVAKPDKAGKRAWSEIRGSSSRSSQLSTSSKFVARRAWEAPVMRVCDPILEIIIFVLARKDLGIFNKKHNSDPTEFYFDVLHHLLNGKFLESDCHYNTYLSQRGNNSLHRFQSAVDKALPAKAQNQANVVKCHLEIVPSKEMPEMSIVGYLIWAVQRKLLTGESRYFDALKSKYASVLNL